MFREADFVSSMPFKVSLTCYPHGIVNVDFADVRTVMVDRGMALMGTGFACGAGAALEAATQAISSPLLEDKPSMVRLAFCSM